MVTPSTSLAGAIASNAARSSMWLGTGCCSRIPCTSGSVESLVSSATSSSVVVAAGSTTLREPMPAFLLRFCFIRTYVAEAGSSPTSTVARHGWTPVSPAASRRGQRRSPPSRRRGRSRSSVQRSCAYSSGHQLECPGARRAPVLTRRPDRPAGRSPVVSHPNASRDPPQLYRSPNPTDHPRLNPLCTAH